MVLSKKSLLTIFLFSIFNFSALAQIRYAAKIETSYLFYNYTTVQVEPGPGWKGYNIDSEENGVGVSCSNGVSLFNNKLYTGIGLGLLNFDGIKGYALYADIDYAPFKTKWNPFLNMNVGYSHLNNQYDNGTATGLVNIGAGLNFNINQTRAVFLKSGVMFTQQAMLFPVTLGFKF